MKIGNYLKESRMLLGLKARSKEEAIREVASILKDAEEIDNLETFLKDVFEREKMATTGIGHEIAIPHARSDTIKDFVIAFGKSREGVEFASLDQRPVKLIFLMGTPKEKKLSAYLKILAHLTRLLEKESFRNSLLKASGPKEVMDVFRKAED